MKLSIREKMLILLLIVTIVIYFLYSQNIFKLDLSNSFFQIEQNELLLQYNFMANKIKGIKENEEKLKELIGLVQAKSIKLYKNINQENIIMYINEYIKSNNINIISLNFTQSENQNLQNDNLELNKEGYIKDLEAISLSILFKSTYEDMLSFINDIETNEKTTSITNISIMQYEESMIRGTITFKFYAIPSITENYTDINEIEYDNIEYGRKNPFALIIE